MIAIFLPLYLLASHLPATPPWTSSRPQVRNTFFQPAALASSVSFGLVEAEQKCPATNTTPLDTRSFATATACLGSQASSPMDNSSCLPITPPALLISATAISAPRLSWSPNAALDPVIGPAVATLMLSALATPTPSAATATAAAAATSFSERTMQDTPCFMHL